MVCCALQAKLQLGQHNDYVLQLASLNNLGAAYSTSNQTNPSIQLVQLHPHSSSLHSTSTLHPQQNIHSESEPWGSVTQLRYHNSILLAGFSAQSIILGWDLRANDFKQNPVIQLDGACNSPFACLDYCAETQMIVGASTKEADTSETQIEIFDVRGTSRRPICIYDEAHSDAITNLRFDPSSNHTLLSASVDGLLILHDTRIQDQDQSILSVGNVGASIATVRFSPDQKSLWCGTDMETLSLWDSTNLTLLQDFGDLRQDCWAYPNSNWTEPVSYLINLTNPSSISSSSHSAYFAGSQSGNVVLVDTSDDNQGNNFQVLGSLEGGHTEMVRCATIDEQSAMILTGGEDGQICLWSTSTSKPQSLNQKLPQSSTSSFLKSHALKTSVGIKSNRFNPY